MLCSAEYLGSTCRLPCGMLNACLLFRDIIIIFSPAGALVRRGTPWPRLPGPSENCWAGVGAGKGLAKLRSPAAASGLRTPGLRYALLRRLCCQSEPMPDSDCRRLQTPVPETAPAPRGRRVILLSPRAYPRAPALPLSRAPPPSLARKRRLLLVFSYCPFSLSTPLRLESFLLSPHSPRAPPPRPPPPLFCPRRRSVAAAPLQRPAAATHNRAPTQPHPSGQVRAPVAKQCLPKDQPPAPPASSAGSLSHRKKKLPNKVAAQASVG